MTDAASDPGAPRALSFPLLALGLVLLAVLAYWPVIADGGYIWDDDDYVHDNPLLTEPDGLREIWLRPSRLPQAYPLVYTTYWIESRFVGNADPDSAWLYHLDNVALHAIAAILLLALLRRLQVPGAAFAAAVFALHPVHVESVAWVAERKNTLSLVFYLLTFLAWLRWRPGFGERGGGGGWYLLALVAFALALLSKTVTSMLAPALLLLTWWRQGRISRQVIVESLPFLALGVAGGVVTSIIEATRVGTVHFESVMDFSERILVAGRALFFYAGKLLWPTELCFNYERWEPDTAVAWQWLLPSGALLLLGTTLLCSRWIGRGLPTALCFYAGTLFPALGFVDVFPFRYSYVADHFVYHASIGLIVLIGATLARLSRRALLPRALSAFLALLVIGLLGTLTWRQCGIYEGLEALWRDTIAKNPRSWLAHNNLGLIHWNRNELPEAESHFRRAAEIYPRARETINNLGLIEAARDNDEEAERLFKKSIELDPAFFYAYDNLGDVYSKMGRLEDAITSYEEAIAQARRVGSNDLRAYRGLGGVYLRMGRYEEAARALSHVARTATHDQHVHLMLGRTYVFLKRYDRAEAAFQRVLELHPGLFDGLEGLAIVAQVRGRGGESLDIWALALAAAPEEKLEASYGWALKALHDAQAELAPDDFADRVVRAVRRSGPRGAELLARSLQRLSSHNHTTHLRALAAKARPLALERGWDRIAAALESHLR